MNFTDLHLYERPKSCWQNILVLHCFVHGCFGHLWVNLLIYKLAESACFNYSNHNWTTHWCYWLPFKYTIKCYLILVLVWFSKGPFLVALCSQGTVNDVGISAFLKLYYEYRNVSDIYGNRPIDVAKLLAKLDDPVF